MKGFKNTLLQINQNGMGFGDKQLGMQLVTSYLKIMNEEDEPARFITFYNEGVKLICNGSPVIEVLQSLQNKGTTLIACKTCLNHFNIIDKIEVGKAGTMMDIIELQKIADKVIVL